MKLINKKTEPILFNQVKFCVNALDLKGDRDWHKCLLINGKIIGTDGKRIHFCDNEFNIKPGVYNIVKNTKQEVVIMFNDQATEDIYPDMKSFFGDLESKEYKHICEFNAEASSTSIALHYINNNISDRTINFNYVKDIPFDNAIFGVFMTEDNELPIKFNAINLTAYVMPMKLN